MSTAKLPATTAAKWRQTGKTVVVTLEYRLNLMGWLAHPALDDEGHLFANYGLLDQQLVLKWVQRNIAFFGGDKNNVTVGGQSAGAIDTGLEYGVAAGYGIVRTRDLRKLLPKCVPAAPPPICLGRGEGRRNVGRGRLRLRHGRVHRQMPA